MCGTLPERGRPSAEAWLIPSIPFGLRWEAAAELNLADAFFADPPVGEDTNRR